MDLREKASFMQRASEYSVRFRLVEILIALMLCVIARVNIEGVIASLRPLVLDVESVAVAFIQRDFGFMLHSEFHGIVFAVLALFVFRWIFFGFKCGLLWFFFLLFNILFFIVIGEFIDVMQILLAGIFIIAATCFFFIRSLMAKSMLPIIILAYSLSVWLLLLGVLNPVWFGLISMFFADTIHLIFVISRQIREDAKNKKTLNGAITYGVRKIIPVSLLSIGLLIIMEIIFCFMKLPMLASEKLWSSIAIYISYILWMPFFTVAVLSFCPLENTCKKIQKKLK